jgi:hypothetical protein
MFNFPQDFTLLFFPSCHIQELIGSRHKVCSRGDFLQRVKVRGDYIRKAPENEKILS